MVHRDIGETMIMLPDRKWRSGDLRGHEDLDGSPRHTSLRSFTDDHGQFWLEQNPAKNSKWAKLARAGHDIAWEFASPGGAYTGRLLIDGIIYTADEATKKFFKPTRR